MNVTVVGTGRSFAGLAPADFKFAGVVCKTMPGGCPATVLPGSVLIAAPTDLFSPLLALNRVPLIKSGL
jgi:hypothetical protein